MLLEICAYNIQSCIRAANAGAHRVELCSAPLQGGVTPGYGIISYVQERLGIPAYIMIRPRGGHYVYDADELDIIRRDILHCREVECPGIVVGAALKDGRLDIENMLRFREWAGNAQLTCHKVFDEVPEPFEALDLLIDAGYDRILTSGLEKTAIEGAGLLKKLVAHAAGRLHIMPGGSVRSSNISQLRELTGAPEFHSSAITGPADDLTANTEEIRQLLEQLNK